MADANKVVAGLRCRDLLVLLADYVEGELATEDRDRVEAHLEGCRECTKFGTEYATLVATLHNCSIAEEPDAGVEDRLFDRMRDVWAEEA